MTNKNENMTSSLSYGVYVVYDSLQQTYDAPFIIPESNIIDDVKLLVNTYGSKYYYHETDYILYKLGTFDTLTGLFNFIETQKIGVLSDFIDDTIRKRQLILHTLNTIPIGYHKMPDELRKEIQDKVDVAIKDYVQEFCDLDKLTPTH